MLAVVAAFSALVEKVNPQKVVAPVGPHIAQLLTNKVEAMGQNGTGKCGYVASI